MAERHPVLRQNGFILPSPPLVEFVGEFSRLLQDGELSMVYYGRQRFGKSTARRFIVEAIESKHEMVVIWATIARDVKQTMPRDQLWRDMLRGRQLKANWLTTKPYATLIKSLLVQAEELGTDIVIIILDEGQNLSLERLGDLKKLLDDLIDEGLSPFVVLGAQPEILLRPERLLRFNKEDLVDRFFVNKYRFRGVLPEEFGEVLGYYDNAVWGGKTYTEHFLPGIWKQGGRLAARATTFQAAFSDLNEKLSTGTQEVGMKYLTAAIRRFFLDVGEGLPTIREQEDVIRQAAETSGLAGAWKVVGNSEKRAQLRAKEVPKRLSEEKA